MGNQLGIVLQFERQILRGDLAGDELEAVPVDRIALGTTQFVGCAIGGVSVGEVMKTIWPFYGALIFTLMLVTYVPAFSMWLPGVLLK